MRLLYIDDDRINTLLFEETCRIVGGIECLVAADGAEALEIARSERPQVLVIDLHLPDTNGHVLLAALRGVEGLAEVPAFLCTAEDPQLVSAAARAAGFRDCWAKPIDIGALMSTLSALAATRPSEA